MSRAVIPGEEELGPQKRCTRCGEWWPSDREFFYFARRGVLKSYCRACREEMRRGLRAQPA